LVGNFGDGRITGYNFSTGASLGQLQDRTGHSLVQKGLWGLLFGNGATAGPTTSLYFAAGPNGEANGLFGSITLSTTPCP